VENRLRSPPSLVHLDFPTASIPLGYAEGEASIIINMLQRTGEQRCFMAQRSMWQSVGVPPPPLSMARYVPEERDF
jgi:hypothetical protein